MLETDNARDGAVNQPGSTDPIITARPMEIDFYKALVSIATSLKRIADSNSPISKPVMPPNVEVKFPA
jgi:hypothetical protein